MQKFYAIIRSMKGNLHNYSLHITGEHMAKVVVVSEKKKRNLRNWPLCIQGTGRFPPQTASWLGLLVMCMTKQKTNAQSKVLNPSSASNTIYSMTIWGFSWVIPGHFDANNTGINGILRVAAFISPGVLCSKAGKRVTRVKFTWSRGIRKQATLCSLL